MWLGKITDGRSTDRPSSRPFGLQRQGGHQGEPDETGQAGEAGQGEQLQFLKGIFLCGLHQWLSLNLRRAVQIPSDWDAKVSKNYFADGAMAIKIEQIVIIYLTS